MSPDSQGGKGFLCPTREMRKGITKAKSQQRCRGKRAQNSRRIRKVQGYRGRCCEKGVTLKKILKAQGGAKLKAKRRSSSSARCEMQDPTEFGMLKRARSAVGTGSSPEGAGTWNPGLLGSVLPSKIWVEQDGSCTQK